MRKFLFVLLFSLAACLLFAGGYDTSVSITDALLRDGSQAMTDNLNMDGNDIDSADALDVNTITNSTDIVVGKALNLLNGYVIPDGIYGYFGTGYDAEIDFDGSDLNIASINVTANDEVNFVDFDKYNFDNTIYSTSNATFLASGWTFEIHNVGQGHVVGITNGSQTINLGGSAGSTFNNTGGGVTLADSQYPVTLTSGSMNISQDDAGVLFGSGQDAYIRFDGVDLIVTSKNVTASDEVNFVGFDAYNFDNNIVVAGDILPDADGTRNIGSPALKFAAGHFSGSTIYLGTNAMSATNGQIYIANGTNAPVPSLPTDGSLAMTGALVVSNDVTISGDLNMDGNSLTNASQVRVTNTVYASDGSLEIALLSNGNAIQVFSGSSKLGYVEANGGLVVTNGDFVADGDGVIRGDMNVDSNLTVTGTINGGAVTENGTNILDVANGKIAVGSFDNGDLVGGLYTNTHNKNVTYPHVTVYNNSSNIIIPDDVTYNDANEVVIDLTTYGTITGTWNIRVSR